MREIEMAEEWLPPGWTAKVTVRKSGKKDKRYFDPEGHKFGSKPEVLRYLKSIERTPELGGKRRSSRNRPTDSPAVAESVSLADGAEKGQKFNSKKRTDTLKDEKILESSADSKGTPVPKATLGNMSEVEKTGNRRPLDGNTKSKNNNKKPDLPRRASKRLAGVEVGPVPELSPISRTRRFSGRRVDNNDAATGKSSLDKFKTIAEDIENDLPFEGSCMPKELNFEVDINKEKDDDEVGISLEVPLPDIWKDPCIEFAIKTLTGEIPIEEVLEKKNAPLKVPEPSGDLWGDPCIDFAVKTLTSDIPIPNFNIENYFQNRDKASDLGFGSVSVSNSNSSFTSAFPPNGNISLQKAG